ncbi:hypothetical protein [Paracraurococcus lichenis]|uniref:Uncharacterized protein n=1 Tax=Paracraurococcus lichenis TaxID=3064888 RepID=A0ABT9E5S5_9PROT|nr:hypothetical protein [Paracraurococcus sp. LOR1-02]MDO9711523.1 hypothetical protein [Paracraurococcus sp. LOR1-02]
MSVMGLPIRDDVSAGGLRRLARPAGDRPAGERAAARRPAMTAIAGWPAASARRCTRVHLVAAFGPAIGEAIRIACLALTQDRLRALIRIVLWRFRADRPASRPARGHQRRP